MDDEFNVPDSDKKIIIDEKGYAKYKLLKELYEPSTKQEAPIHYEHNNYSITATGDINAPVLTGGIRNSTVTDSFKANEESQEIKELNKKGFKINKWILIVGIFAIVVSIVLWILSK